MTFGELIMARVGRPRERLVLLLLVIATTFIIICSLWSSYEWRLPKFSNGALILSDNSLRFAAPGIAATTNPPVWIDEAKRTHKLNVRIQLKTSIVNQSGPARIFTLSADQRERNLTIAQDKDDLILRLRTPLTDNNGLIKDKPIIRVDNIFETGGWLDIQLSIESGKLCLISGDQRKNCRTISETPLANWNSSYRLALGNELTNNRPWLGEIREATVMTGDIAINYIGSDKIAVPRLFYMSSHRPPSLVPLVNSNLRDVVQNIFMYMPFGFILAILFGNIKKSVILKIMMLSGCLSLLMEALQLAIPPRFTSIDDVIFNIIGGTIGAGLAFLSPKLRASIASRMVA